MSAFALKHLDRGSFDELRRRGEESTEQAPLELNLALHERPEPWQGALFAGALMTSLGDIPLRISHEADEGILQNVFRSGLAAALGSRLGLTTYVDPTSPLNSPVLRATWTPGAPEFRAAMFHEGKDISTGLFGPTHALFLNPHRTTTPPGPSSITRLVRRWILKHLDGLEKPDVYLQNIGFVLDQLIVNISEHAVTESTPSVTSLVRVEVEAGKEGPTLIVVVVDTGAGIVSTLRPKLEDAPSSDPQLLGELLRGELSGWGRARGIGLSRLASLVQDNDGYLLVTVQNANAAVDQGGVKVDNPSVTTDGTVISLSLPLQN